DSSTLACGDDGQLGAAGNAVWLNGSAATLRTTAPVTSARALNVTAGSIDTNGFDSTFASVTGAGSLAKIGAGALVLSGANSYTGTIAVNAGTLQISSDANLGNTATNAGLTINNGATLATTGSFYTNRQLNLGLPGGATQPDGATVSAILDVASGTEPV